MVAMNEQENTAAPKWDERNSANFIDYADIFVPDRAGQVAAICDLIPPPRSGGHIVELCCGEGLLAEALLERFPASTLHGFDGSPTMLAAARERLGRFGQRFEPRLFDLADQSWRHLPWPCDAVVSSLAIHHLTDDEKRDLFRDVFAMLAPGGAFVVADVVQPRGALAVALAARTYDAIVREQSLQTYGDLRGYEQFRALDWNPFSLAEPDPIDKPAPLAEQLRWLEEVGFADVDAYWVRAGHAIFGGTRPPDPAR